MVDLETRHSVRSSKFRCLSVGVENPLKRNSRHSTHFTAAPDREHCLPGDFCNATSRDHERRERASKLSFISVVWYDLEMIRLVRHQRDMGSAWQFSPTSGDPGVS